MPSHIHVPHTLYRTNNSVEFFENLPIGKSCMYFLEKIKYYIHTHCHHLFVTKI